MIAHFFFKIKTYLNYHLRAVNDHGLHSPFLFDFYNEVIAAKKSFIFLSNSGNTFCIHEVYFEADALFLYRWVAFYKPNSVFVASENFPASWL